MSVAKLAQILRQMDRSVKARATFRNGAVVEILDETHVLVDIGKPVPAFVSPIFVSAMALDQLVTVRLQDSSYVISDVLVGTIAGLISLDDQGRLRQLTNGVLNRWPVLVNVDGTPDTGGAQVSITTLGVQAGWSIVVNDPAASVECRLSRKEWCADADSWSMSQSLAIKLTDLLV